MNISVLIYEHAWRVNWFPRRQKQIDLWKIGGFSNIGFPKLITVYKFTLCRVVYFSKQQFLKNWCQNQFLLHIWMCLENFFLPSMYRQTRTKTLFYLIEEKIYGIDKFYSRQVITLETKSHFKEAYLDYWKTFEQFDEMLIYRRF